MRELDRKLRQVHRRLAIKPGEIYESCSYHPVMCLGVNYKTDSIWGVSLIDGSYPCSCSLLHCGIRKLSPKEAWQIKSSGPLDAEAREKITPQNRWWREGAATKELRVGLVGPKVPKSVALKAKGNHGV